MKKETENQNLHNTVVSTLQAENKQYTHNSSLCKPDTIENQSSADAMISEKQELYVIAMLDGKVIFDDKSFVPKDKPMTDWEKEQGIERFYKVMIPR